MMRVKIKTEIYALLPSKFIGLFEFRLEHLFFAYRLISLPLNTQRDIYSQLALYVKQTKRFKNLTTTKK